MHDSFLYQKICDAVKTMCEEQKIKQLKKMELVVNHDSHVTSKLLKEDLIQKIPAYISKRTKIIVDKDNLGELTAVIKNIEGVQ